MQMRQELSLSEIKELELQLLKSIHAICKKQNIRYTLAYGTMLGAVRHKGFIPWDDDIDIIMPRPDYERFFNYCSKHDVDFGFATCTLNPAYHSTSGKVWDKHSVIEDPYRNYDDVNIGAFVDIMPMDGLGQGDKGNALKRLKPFILYNKYLAAVGWDKYSRSATNPWYTEPIRLGLFLVTRLINKNKVFIKATNKMRRYNFNKSDYVAALCVTKTPRAIKPKKMFDEFCEMDFEDQKFCVIKDYDIFLRDTYGDYMQLPPVEKQKAHHAMKVYRV